MPIKFSEAYNGFRAAGLPLAEALTAAEIMTGINTAAKGEVGAVRGYPGINPELIRNSESYRN